MNGMEAIKAFGAVFMRFARKWREDIYGDCFSPRQRRRQNLYEFNWVWTRVIWSIVRSIVRQHMYKWNRKSLNRMVATALVSSRHTRTHLTLPCLLCAHEINPCFITILSIVQRSRRPHPSLVRNLKQRKFDARIGDP